jgi:hypothetical protein
MNAKENEKERIPTFLAHSIGFDWSEIKTNITSMKELDRIENQAYEANNMVSNAK